MTWETTNYEPKPTQSQLDYIDSLYATLQLDGSDIIEPTTMQEASELIDQLKEELGWTE